MADEKTTTDTVKSLTADAAKYAEEKAKKAKEILENFSKSVEELSKEAEERIINFTNSNFQEFCKNLEDSDTRLKGLALTVGNIALTLKTGIDTTVFSSISDAAIDTTSDINQTIDSLNKLTFNKLSANIITKGLSETLLKSDAARKFEQGILQMTARSGEFSDMVNQVGDDLSGMEETVVSFSDMLYKTANISGMSLSQIAKYATELGNIPGALSETIPALRESGTNMNMLDAVMKLSAGTGQNVTDVIKDLDFSFREFNTTGKESLEFVARMSAASTGLRIPLDLVKEYTKGSAQSFRFFADNSQAAINILGKFGGALKDSGLGPKAIADLTQGITKNIASMSIAQRAFLSSSTGGPGGLQGAYQIELLKKQGKTDEIEKLMEKSLRQQFGGKIVTLEDAAKDQRAAAQFTKQIQLLTQGPTKLTDDEGIAERIIEAMAKGDKFKVPIKEKEEALSDAVDLGNNIQERNYNQLTVISNWAQRNAFWASITANKISQALGGKEGILSEDFEAIRETEEKAATMGLLPKLESAEDRKNLNETMDDIAAGLIPAIGNKLEGYLSKINNFVSPDKQDKENIIQEPPQKQVSDMMDKQQKEDKDNLGKKTASNESNKLEIQNTVICPVCQKSEMTKTAQVVFSGNIKEVKKNEITHVHSGANIA